MRQVGSVLWPKLRVLQIYGANTGVGKTIFSSILCGAFQRHFPRVHYLKPVSTGPLEDADDRHISNLGRKVRAKCLFQFSEPVSPHIAARSSPEPVTDEVVRSATYNELRTYATGEDGIAIVETAGGVLSPAPSGSSQADLYRPLRLPVLLVGDHQLGGIGTTISAWESLHIRGYDVQGVALFAENRYDNHTYLREYFADRKIHAFSIAPPPERDSDVAKDAEAMREYYDRSIADERVLQFTNHINQSHNHRVSQIQSMPAEAEQAIWHPFMQHTERSKDTIVAMDSAYDDYFQTYTTKQSSDRDVQGEPSLLKPAFDGSASWWTQGLGHGNPQLALTAAHAAGRYGHVMFAGAVHEPALRLAQTLINNMGNPRLSKVFFTDNGSAGMEVAVKMALRAAAVRNGWSADDDIRILGLQGSYHGDTIGTMDCSEPSIYNKKVEWYTGRGQWLDFPQVKMRKGHWLVEPPASLESVLGGGKEFDSLDEIFAYEGRGHEERLYKDYLTSWLTEQKEQGVKFGALIMEPILLGAGGMMFADPLFQRCLVQCVREQHPAPQDASKHNWSGMPVIFDEIFTGLYRLGRFSAASFLGVQPDIVANAKLLTGGLLPLCTTTASQAIFEAFLSKDKSDALLHGHSYTAHAVGSAVANKSLDTMLTMEKSSCWDTFKEDWLSSGPVTNAPTKPPTGVWSMWSNGFVKAVSHRPDVDYAFALGSVLVIAMKDPAGASYASAAGAGLRDRLFTAEAKDETVIHSRVLGNVLYLMAAITTSRKTLEAVEEKVFNALTK